MLCLRILQVVAGLLLCCAAATPLSAQCQANEACDIGQFSGPWNWDAQVCTLHLECPNSSTIEFYHGAVVTKGLHAGKVLLLRVDSRGPAVSGACPNTGRLETWLFDPDSPTILIHIQHAEPVPSFINCAGNALDPQGRLMMVGGAPTKKVFRFDPMQLGHIVYKLPLPSGAEQCSPAVIFAEPWSKVDEIDDLQTERYYPTAMTATREPIDDPGSSTHGIGGATFVLGGPAGSGGGEGNYVWELLEPGGTVWADPLVPKGYPPTFLGAYEEFELMPVGDEPNPRLDSYPRAFQLSKAAQRQIYVAGDTQTGNAGPPPGSPELTGEQTWTMKIPYADLLVPQTEWELHTSPEMGSQHSYGNAVLMFNKNETGTLFIQNRILVIGGGQHEENPNNPGSWPLVSVTNAVREYVPGSDAAGGHWEDKASLYFEGRYQANSVLLPDRTILVAGGRSNLGWAPGPQQPIYEPEIYDPGATPTDSGSTKVMASSHDATWGQPVPPTQVPRMYHSMAFLLADGRVLLVGGRHGAFNQAGNPDWSDSRMSGEIFSPPYLFEGNALIARPTINGVQLSDPEFQELSTETNTLTFRVSVTPQAGEIEMVSLIRLASQTHHFDSDQRFIELAYTGDTTPESSSILIVDAPVEDIAPQGWYYLFVLEENDGRLIPSVAHIINFQ